MDGLVPKSHFIQILSRLVRLIRILIKPLKSSYIVGGHTFLGLEAHLPGSFDVWMNYREDPWLGLNSGIIRFYITKWSSESYEISSEPDLPLAVLLGHILSYPLRTKSMNF